jgi:hypothetical protein
MGYKHHYHLKDGSSYKDALLIVFVLKNYWRPSPRNNGAGLSFLYSITKYPNLFDNPSITWLYKSEQTTTDLP